MKRIYFDNAATTLIKPREVIRKTIRFIRQGYANAGRSGHFLSMKTAQEIFEAREAVSRFLGYYAPQNVVFTQNATLALNQAIKGLICNGSHVITTMMEHNSVLRPLYSMEEQGQIRLSIVSHRGNVEENIKTALKENTRAIVCSLTSNVTGECIPLDILSRLRQELGVLVIVDASQLLGHAKIDLYKYPVDALCAAGHKGAFGMQGVGFAFYLSAPERTIVEGGSGFDSFATAMPKSLPEKLEAGTLSAVPIMSLKYGLEFIERIGISSISEKLKRLDDRINDILSEAKGLKALCRGKHGIHSFVVIGKSSSEAACLLEQEGFLVRSGFHCAPMLHKEYGTQDSGAVRISFSYFNKPSEIERFYKAIKRLQMT